MTSLFISYRRSDSPDTVARIHEKLSQHFRNWEVFYDHKSIDLGAEFPDVLRQKVSAADIVLVMIGPKWLEEIKGRTSAPIDHVREEIRLALASNTTIIPILMVNARMPSAKDLVDFPDLLPLLKKNAQSIDPDPHFTPDCEKLIQFLERSFQADFIGSTILGKFKVLRPIGEGGMGEVFVAEQFQPVRRQVALKVIKLGMDSKEVVARFDAERQALAVMDHPNVCKVLDAGITQTGRPFFAMEFVKGVPITQYCDDRKLTPKARLELFMTVCKGVQHAHQKGIIHRDIKPSNILVEEIDGKPVPKVIDFGLAKAMGQKLTEKSFIGTEFGKWVGTLEYSSPEQAEGRPYIDSLSDIYSLGVLLYELLAGSPPFTRAEMLKAGDEEIRRMIREKEPSKPSTKLSSSQNLPAIAANRQLDPAKLTGVIRGELDWIVMKALEKEPARRYATATAFAEDLQHYLSNEPISAGRPSGFHRFRKFVKRNRGPVLAGSMVVMALAAGIVGTSVGLVRAEREAQRANEQAEIADQQAELARKEAEKAMKEKDNAELAQDKALRSAKEADKERAKAKERENLAIEAISRFAESINANPDLKNLPELASLRKSLLDEPIQFFEKLAADLNLKPSNSEESLEVLGNAQLRLGLLINEIGDQENALIALSGAIKTFLKIQDLNSNGVNSDIKLNLSKCYNTKGKIYLVQSKLELAESELKTGLNLRKELASDFPHNIDFMIDLAASYNNLGILNVRLEDDISAFKNYKTSISILKNAKESSSVGKQTKNRILSELASTYNNVGGLHALKGDGGMALQYYNDSSRILEVLALSFADDYLVKSDLARSLVNIATLESAQRNVSAEKSYEEGVRLCRDLYKKHPSIISIQEQYIWSLRRFAAFQDKKKNEGLASQLRNEASFIEEKCSIKIQELDFNSLHGRRFISTSGFKSIHPDKQTDKPFFLLPNRTSSEISNRSLHQPQSDSPMKDP